MFILWKCYDVPVARAQYTHKKQLNKFSSLPLKFQLLIYWIKQFYEYEMQSSHTFSIHHLWMRSLWMLCVISNAIATSRINKFQIFTKWNFFVSYLIIKSIILPESNQRQKTFQLKWKEWRETRTQLTNTRSESVEKLCREWKFRRVCRRVLSRRELICQFSHFISI